jgi:hypothetical protein
VIPGLPRETVTLIRFGAQALLPSGRPNPVQPAPTTTTLAVIVEPWRADRSPPRPEGQTTETTRLFVMPVEVRGAVQGVSGPTIPDRIAWDGATWVVAEVVRAPAMPGIPAAWHAYCVRRQAGDTPYDPAVS